MRYGPSFYARLLPSRTIFANRLVLYTSCIYINFPLYSSRNCRISFCLYIMLIMPAQLNIIADALHYYADGCNGGGLDAEVMPLPLSCARPHVYINL